MSKQTSAASGNQPVQTLRHRSLKASIWRNQTEKGPMYNVTIARSYRDEEGWHDSQSFGYDDLLVVAKLMYDAHSFITEQRARERAGRENSRRSERSSS